MNFKWRIERGIKVLSASFRWSSLAVIGDSLLIKLTIVAPFLGYIILYNDYIISFLTLSNLHFDQLNVENAERSNETIRRINYLYFGFISMGVASALFSFFCPQPIAKHRYEIDFIQSVSPSSSDSILRNYWEYVLKLYRGEFTDNECYKLFTMPYPESFFINVQTFVNDMYLGKESEEIQRGNIPNLDSSDGQEPIDSDIYSASGYIRTDLIVERALHGARVTEIFYWALMRDVQPFARDILNFYHTAMDYSRFWLRMAVAMLYLLGFTLLSIPTIQTAILLFWYWVA